MPTPGHDRPVSPRRVSGADDRKALKLAIAVAAAVLLGLAAFVVIGLPAYVAQREPVAVDATAVPPPVALSSPAPAAATRVVSDADRPEAERLHGDALRLVARLESEGVRVWGHETVAGTSLGEAEQALRNANAAFDRQQFVDAIALFRTAMARFDALAQTRPERFRLAMANGHAALAARDPAAAERQFAIAAAAEPGDTQAAALLERARKLPQVLARMAEGEQAEAAGDLDKAAAGYRAAATLDPAYEAARAKLAQVEQERAVRAYRAAVSEVLARLGDGNVRAATAALERARQANPSGPELADLRQRVQAAGRTATLERLRDQAAALERQEKWAEALKIYDQALALDRDAAFAQRGRAQAQQLAHLHTALDAYLADPGRLRSVDPLAHARTLVAPGAPGEDGPRLAEKRQKLAQLIAAAQTPVPVLLQSDQATEVTVLRLGKLGTFGQRRIELPPGRYVAVGSRNGYRDVRVSFDVTAGAADQPVLVQCTEPIR